MRPYLVPLLFEEFEIFRSLLRKLWIEDCPQMAFLPDGMSYLATMEECHITNCPKMIRRCQRETGVDWYKISHVRDICQKALMSTIQSTIAWYVSELPLIISIAFLCSFHSILCLLSPPCNCVFHFLALYISSRLILIISFVGGCSIFSNLSPIPPRGGGGGELGVYCQRLQEIN